MNGFKKVWYGMDKILFQLVSVLIVASLSALVVVATAQVLMRYFLKMPLRWSNEFCCFMLVYTVFLAASLALRYGEHVRLDITKFPFPRPLIRMMDAISVIAVYLFLGVYTYYGYRFTVANGSAVTEVMKWPYAVLYCVLPISGILMLIGETTSLLKKTDRKDNESLRGNGNDAGSETKGVRA
ncbi:MAG: TRAP transporter small permease [Lachnospiraceae bacterium]|nr:TRAP transporter small permease [Lachnospiraceae bacterium]